MSTYTDSADVDAGIVLLGLWLHDPLDPAGTVRSYLYGANARETSIDVEGEGTFYAGRTFPVMDYGEHEDVSVTVQVDIPHGPTYAQELADLEGWARARRTLHLRDNRGRNLRGSMRDFRHQDASWGSVASFVLAQAHVVDTEVM